MQHLKFLKYQDAPHEYLRLGIDEVHVWRAVLQQPGPVIEKLEKILSPDERNRAAAFHFRKHRERFVIARAALRSLIGRYLSVSPAQLGFCYGSQGKPSLAGIYSQSLRFNVSHSHDLALFAFTRDRDVGLDLEHFRESFASQEIAERFFSPQELAMFRKLPSHERVQGFFNCWTRKEAYLKAIGTGLSMPLTQFTVSLAPGEPAALLEAHDPEEVSRWSLRELSPGHGYVAAIAVEGNNWNLTCWQSEHELN